MRKNLFLLFLSIFEILRWIMIYLFFNFVKSNLLDAGGLISGECWLWFGSNFFINVLFGLSGILCYLNYNKYYIMLRFWGIFKLILIIYIVFLLLSQKIDISTYFVTLAPVDLFIFFYLFFMTDKKTDENENKIID
jgi:hypothetical protein